MSSYYERNKERILQKRKEHHKRTYVKKGSKGEKHHAWKGDKVGNTQLHTWVRKNKPKPKLCEHCKKIKKLELANISIRRGAITYNREFKNWMWLCHKCHYEYDFSGENNNAWKGGIKSLNPKKYQRERTYTNDCIDCNKSITNKATRCKSCSNKFRRGCKNDN